MTPDPFDGDQLDRTYGDQESDYVTIQPEVAAATGREPRGDLEAEQEARAGEEAAAIGGRPVAEETGAPDFDLDGSDPAFEPVAQGGGGQAEGFEQSEAPLIKHAENPPERELTADGFDLEDPGTDVEDDVAVVVVVVATNLSDLDRDDQGTLATPRDREALRASGEAGQADEVYSSEVTLTPTRDVGVNVAVLLRSDVDDMSLMETSFELAFVLLCETAADARAAPARRRDSVAAHTSGSSHDAPDHPTRSPRKGDGEGVAGMLSRVLISG